MFEKNCSMTAFMKKNWGKVMLTVIGVITAYIYFFYIYNRVNRYLGKMIAYKPYLNQTSLIGCKKVMDGDFKLCDFYICSSYKSYLPCTNYYDYSDIRAIIESLHYGARYIDLDIFNKSFNPCTEPVVCAGRERGNWHFTNRLTFDDCCRAIAKVGFSSAVNGNSDPLFINLNLFVDGNVSTVNKIADILNTHFGHKLLPRKYSKQGMNPDPQNAVNISTTPIKKLLNRVIILCDNYKLIKGTKLNELVNICANNMGNLRHLTYNQTRESYDPQELKDFNKKYLTRVVPNFKKRTKENFNYNIPWYLGCQFICMNITKPDEYSISYMRRFKKCSYVLKPYKLRYHPVTIEPPKAQLPQVSFAPEKVSTPFYSITY